MKWFWIVSTLICHTDDSSRCDWRDSEWPTFETRVRCNNYLNQKFKGMEINTKKCVYRPILDEQKHK